MSKINIDNEQSPIVSGLFTWPSDKPHLLGARCETCGAVFFPSFCQLHDPKCEQRKVVDILLSPRGILTSYTVQHFQPPPPYIGPQLFAPYAIDWLRYQKE